MINIYMVRNHEKDICRHKCLRRSVEKLNPISILWITENQFH